MPKIIRNIGTHTLEADWSGWTGMAKIRLDGQELMSKLTFGHKEIITVDDEKYAVIFSGSMLSPNNIEIYKI